MKNFLVGDSISPVDDVPDTELIDAVEPEFEPELLSFENAVEDVPEHMPNAGKLKIESIRFYQNRLNRIKSNCLIGDTPVSHRVSMLRASGANQRGTKSPNTPIGAARDNDGGNLFDSFNTPDRENIQRDLNEASGTETPETKRKRWEDDERGTPEYARTPYLLEQKRKFLQERIDRYKPTESEKNKKKSTVSTIGPVAMPCDSWMIPFALH